MQQQHIGRFVRETQQLYVLWFIRGDRDFTWKDFYLQRTGFGPGTWQWFVMNTLLQDGSLESALEMPLG